MEGAEIEWIAPLDTLHVYNAAYKVTVSHWNTVSVELLGCDHEKVSRCCVLTQA